ncbi:autoinducer binding domain-containing protein [Profundibacterium mesophilum]|uniref:Transcriptional regulator LuxR family protein n=1 Tax=Profundibacterium mesophilum KAUST100406-0324 TaxID=1037889 RepID=A0A921NPM9_9RHOB|nr:autoinducer binding domain-containing protein [Profundibacterium mesophilum]KAF0676191.1 Transcriptional regulator LuxR family protein [Profundibacterium mesophilum KAUST100406-0324]
MEHDLIQSELDKLAALTTAGYFAALHIRFTSPVHQFMTYGEDWVQHYTAQGYVMRDPAVAWAFSTTGAVRWSDPDLPDPFEIFADAARHGLKFGTTVSVGAIGSRSVISSARGDREHTDEEIGELERIGARLHDLTPPKVALTNAQLAALSHIAAGHRHTSAAAELGISESALKLRLASARERLQARTTAEAVRRAKESGLI